MVEELKLGEISVEVVQKDIKNIHLSVYPPTGKVRISAPLRMKFDAIRMFALSKLSWIKSKQKKLNNQKRESQREFIDRESHYLWGRRYLLNIVESVQSPRVELKHDKIVLHVKQKSSRRTMEALVEQWYRDLIKEEAPEIIAKWEPILGVKVKRVFVQLMKTKWGSCSPKTASVRLNTELARKPKEFLEYIIVHEMTHLRVPTHNARFASIMDQNMPNWRQYRDELNRLPLRDVTWS
ncbi:MAG: SprT family zinc-dependent metalloprotease [Bdellovibrionota bacterium]